MTGMSGEINLFETGCVLVVSTWREQIENIGQDVKVGG